MFVVGSRQLHRTFELDGNAMSEDVRPFHKKIPRFSTSRRAILNFVDVHPQVQCGLCSEERLSKGTQW